MERTTWKGLIRVIFLAGLLAGTLDGLAAVVQYYLATGRDPSRVFLYIASGVFGRDAYDSGAIMIVAGILFHYSFATGWSGLYLTLYPRVKVIRRSVLLSGFAYGTLVWVGMNQVVIPLSRITPPPFDILNAAKAAVILVLCVGLPVAFFARRHYSGSAS